MKSAARDEIGDLGRTVYSMLNQLKQQVVHREKMADNLEHEMRTPLAGVAASLKNLEQELDDPPLQSMTKDDRPHLGLGLYIVRTILKLHGGKVSVQNLQDDRAGVVFSLTLPTEG
jgi:signal transduction histidine kinase